MKQLGRTKVDGVMVNVNCDSNGTVILEMQGKVNASLKMNKTWSNKICGLHSIHELSNILRIC